MKNDTETLESSAAPGGATNEPTPETAPRMTADSGPESTVVTVDVIPEREAEPAPHDAGTTIYVDTSDDAEAGGTTTSPAGAGEIDPTDDPAAETFIEIAPPAVVDPTVTTTGAPEESAARPPKPTAAETKASTAPQGMAAPASPPPAAQEATAPASGENSEAEPPPAGGATVLQNADLTSRIAESLQGSTDWSPWDGLTDEQAPAETAEIITRSVLRASAALVDAARPDGMQKTDGLADAAAFAVAAMHVESTLGASIADIIAAGGTAAARALHVLRRTARDLQAASRRLGRDRRRRHNPTVGAATTTPQESTDGQPAAAPPHESYDASEAEEPNVETNEPADPVPAADSTPAEVPSRHQPSPRRERTARGRRTERLEKPAPGESEPGPPHEHYDADEREAPAVETQEAADPEAAVDSAPDGETAEKEAAKLREARRTRGKSSSERREPEIEADTAAESRAGLLAAAYSYRIGKGLTRTPDESTAMAMAANAVRAARTIARGLIHLDDQSWRAWLAQHDTPVRLYMDHETTVPGTGRPNELPYWRKAKP